MWLHLINFRVFENDPKGNIYLNLAGLLSRANQKRSNFKDGSDKQEHLLQNHSNTVTFL